MANASSSSGNAGGHPPFRCAFRLRMAAWAYGSAMPRLPWLGTGLSPLAQWLVVSAPALAWAGRTRNRDASGR